MAYTHEQLLIAYAMRNFMQEGQKAFLLFNFTF